MAAAPRERLMDHSPTALRRQRMHGCTPFDIAGWCHSRRVRTVGFARAFDDGSCLEEAEEEEEEDDVGREFRQAYCQPTGRAPAASTGIRRLWRRVVREKRRILMRSSRRRVPRGHAPYDEYTYAQNFDEGAAWDDDAEPEDLARSFSARFAVPSRVLQRAG